SAGSFLWARLAAPDPTFALPLFAGALLAAIVALQASGAKGRWLGALFVVGITWLVATCNAGAQLYLVASFTALLLQSLFGRRARRPPAAAPRASQAPPRVQKAPPRAREGLVPLPAAAGRDDLGGKARRLGDLVAAGFHVPDGFVVPDGHA